MKNRQWMIDELNKGKRAILDRGLTGTFGRSVRKGVARKPMQQQAASRRLDLR